MDFKKESTKNIAKAIKPPERYLKVKKRKNKLEKLITKFEGKGKRIGWNQFIKLI